MITSLAVESAVSQLAPLGPPVTVDELLAWPSTSASPFATTRRVTLARLSQRILRDPTLRTDAARVALAYWLRRANLDRLAETFDRRQSLEPDIVFVPVGRVFHVAPGNVDTVFVYSWALSYLCGNQNVVRVSGQQSEVLASLLRALAALMQDDAELAVANRFVTYPHDGSVSAALSQWATHRVVWGGDETVTLFRALPLSPHASERAFGSKYSYSVISAESYDRATDETVATLAAGYFNDIFWFEQMACSSPHLIAWIGPSAVTKAAIARFHAALEREIERRGHRGSPSSAIHRLNYVFDLALAHTHAAANPAPRWHRAYESHRSQTATDDRPDILDAHGGVEEAAEERQCQEPMRDRRPVRGVRSRTCHVDVNPLPIFSQVCEPLDPVLIDIDEVTDADLGVEVDLQIRQIDHCHSGSLHEWTAVGRA